MPEKSFVDIPDIPSEEQPFEDVITQEQQIPAPIIIPITAPFQSFEKYPGFECSFNGVAIAKGDQWECTVTDDGKASFSGLRPVKLLGMCRKVHGNRPGECTLTFLHFLSTRQTLSQGESDLADVARALIEEVKPVLPRLQAYPVYRRETRAQTQQLLAG